MTKKKNEKDTPAVHPDSTAPPQEQVVYLLLTELHPFPEQPYAVRDDPAMQTTADSIKSYGVLTPAIVRPIADGGYEIISGHRRKYGCELAGLDTMPCIVRALDDDEAIIQLVDSNAQREDVLPSENEPRRIKCDWTRSSVVLGGRQRTAKKMVPKLVTILMTKRVSKSWQIRPVKAKAKCNDISV